MLFVMLFFGFVTLAFTDFKQECVDEHNIYRSWHSANPLVLNDYLQDVAQKYATKLADEEKFEHSGNGYSENLYVLHGSTDITGATAVDSWYDEIKNYDFSNPGFSEATGHFTQVVWKGSQYLGCAYATHGNSIIVVANYYPPGNVIGYFRENVSPN